jgi:hypothetical protein
MFHSSGEQRQSRSSIDFLYPVHLKAGIELIPNLNELRKWAKSKVIVVISVTVPISERF